jgi:hypothetical protein
MQSLPAVGHGSPLRRLLVAGAGTFAIVAFAFWVAWVALLAGAWPAASFPKTDFFTFYAASLLALDGMASSAYEAEVIAHAEAGLPGDDGGFFAWLNPPAFFFVVLPLALLPVAVSFAVWTITTAMLAFSAVYRIAVDRLALLLALTFPPTLANLLIGHNGLLIAGVFGWGMLLLRDRPVAAGAVLGLLAFKPQFFPLTFIALIAAREYRAAAAAAACIMAVYAASLAAFGADSWIGFLEVGDRYAVLLYDGGLNLGKMQSVSAVLLLLGLPEAGARAVQVLVAAACCILVWWLWRGADISFEYRAAGLALATLLATPYSYMYDLTIMGMAALWMVVAFQRDGWRRGDGVALALAWTGPLSVFLGLSLMPLVLLALVAVIVRRVQSPAGRTLFAPVL